MELVAQGSWIPYEPLVRPLLRPPHQNSVANTESVTNLLALIENNSGAFATCKALAI